VYWLPVQQYCRITRPGKYRLFCLRQDPDHFGKDEVVDTEFLEALPPDVVTEAGASDPLFDVEKITDYARFTVWIVQGTAKERKAMVRHWLRLARNSRGSKPCDDSPQRGAIFRALDHVMQNDFLEWYAETMPWVTTAGTEKRLFFVSEETERWECGLLSADEANRRIPELIENLTARDAFTRSLAFFHLRLWTDSSFGHDWQGHDSMRPTLEQGRRTQETWRNWWAARN